MISRWEAGVNLPSIADLVTLADFYRITLDELIGRSAPEDEEEEGGED